MQSSVLRKSYNRFQTYHKVRIRHIHTLAVQYLRRTVGDQGGDAECHGDAVIQKCMDVAPCSKEPPWMIIPSSVGVISHPIAFRLSVIVSIRSVSFTFSSAASLMIVVPSACDAMTAIIGISSIRVGIRSPWIVVPCRLLVRTRMSRSARRPPSAHSKV